MPSPRSPIRPLLFIVLSTLLLAGLAAAEDLTGTVTNKTTGKPSAGDDVVLIKLAQGMEEGARTKTNAKGEFTLPLDNAANPHLVRVNHQAVNYFRQAPPGTSAVDVEVYDVARKIPGIATPIDIMAFQTDKGFLEVVEKFVVRNTSTPPRTQMNENNYEFQLPNGAIVDSGLAKGPNGQPVSSAPVPLAQKNRYAFAFPLRPGETQFQVSYHLPYSGQARIEPKLLSAMEHFVVMLPKEMQFKPEAGSFQSIPDETGANVQVVTGVQPSQPLAFTVGGNGTLHLGDEQAQGGGGESGAASGPEVANSRRPGGGLGPPTDSPDPLHQYRWFILSGFVAVLAFGAVYIATRSASAPRAVAAGAAGNGGAGSRSAALPQPNRSALLLEALKEEMFELEVERQQGRISHQDYEKSKAALDQTLQRAITRKK